MVTKTPRPYQQEAIAFAADVGKLVLADPPGAGKTVEVSAMFEEWLAPFGLIVAPKAVLRHWAADYEAVTGRKPFLHLSSNGSPRERIALLKQAVIDRQTVITNYERFRHDIDHLVGIPFQAFAFDEAHRLKNRDTKQTKAAWKITRGAAHVVLATGTPVMNRADELWSYLRTLFPQRFTSFWKFAREHFAITERWVQGRIVMEIGELLPGHDEILRRSLSGVMFQRTLAEVLPHLPEVTVIEYPVEMTDRERAEYDRLEDHNWADFDGEIVSVNNVLSKMTRHRQITSDWSALNPALGHGSKVKAAAELIADLTEDGEQVVVFTNFKATAYNVVQSLPPGVDGRVWTGDQSQKTRDETLAAFKDGTCRVVVGTIDAIGEGVDGLQVARHAVYIDRHYVPARNEQSIGRVRRSGQTADKIVEHRFFMEGTIDQTIEQMLAIKERRIESVRVDTRALLNGTAFRQEEAA